MARGPQRQAPAPTTLGARTRADHMDAGSSPVPRPRAFLEAEGPSFRREEGRVKLSRLPWVGTGLNRGFHLRRS